MYESARQKLLDVGLGLIRAESFSAIGINDVLKAAAVPRGSFYHYFESKEAFGLQVAQHYHEQQMDAARLVLRDETDVPLMRLRRFFAGAREDYAARKFREGCLMCNLSTEMADNHPVFRALLSRHWGELSQEIAQSLTPDALSRLGLARLSPGEAADWLLNAWSGALARMKAEGNDGPLRLFEKSVFPE